MFPANQALLNTSPRSCAHDHEDPKASLKQATGNPHAPAQPWVWRTVLLWTHKALGTKSQPVSTAGTCRNWRESTPPISHRPLKGSHLNPGWWHPKMSILLPVPATRYAWMMRSHDTSGITWSVPQEQGVEETWEKLCAWRPILSAKREQEACIWLAHNYMIGLNLKLEFLSLCGPLNPFKSKLSKCKCHFEINTCFMLAEIHRGKIFQLCRKTNRNPLWGGN